MEKLERSYALGRTPVREGEKIDEPGALPAGVEPAPRRLLTGRFGLEVLRPSRLSVLGFLGGWLAVAALIGGFVLFVRFA